MITVQAFVRSAFYLVSSQTYGRLSTGDSARRFDQAKDING